ncbi:unnamed protein product [Chironomus riparius]|uniref:Decapping nuclease n=1 Tax=Chironomus riparius TaxID=315576 RepID=A0A9N9WUW9_9DIPT|nr:unnamed protein product [Chironomus riparius]
MAQNNFEELISEQQEIELTNSEIIGAYSVDQNGVYKNDLSALKYLKKQYWNAPQDVNFDLKEIYKRMEPIEKKPHDYLERLTKLTRFIQENPKNIIKNKRVDADFVCFRGVLTNILRSFYDCLGFVLEAVKLKETIYLALKTNKQEPSPHLTIFETCLLSTDPKDESAAIKKDEFNIVLSREINELKILFAAECDGIISVDAIENIHDLEQSMLIEVKTKLDKPEHSSPTFYDYNKLYTWCQSFIASIDTIYVGKRNDQDIVNRIEKFDLETLEYPKHSSKFWEKNDCLNRLREFLRNIKEDMQAVDDPRKVFSYNWKERPKKGPKNKFPIFADELDDRENLSQEYISFINNLK